MYKLINLLFLRFTNVDRMREVAKLPYASKIYIRNKELPICSNCSYFIEHKNNYPYDAIPSDEQYGRCKTFGEVNLITGVIDYDLARNCRLTDNKCGKLGSEYSNKPNY
jgi:hypothetical protein